MNLLVLSTYYSTIKNVYMVGVIETDSSRLHVFLKWLNIFSPTKKLHFSPKMLFLDHVALHVETYNLEKTLAN